MEQFATWKLFTIIKSLSVSPINVELKTVTFLSVEDVILLPLITETLTKELLIVDEEMFESNVVLFSIVVFSMIPLVALAFRNVLFETNVFMRVTFVRMEPAIELFSTLLFTIVELVIFTPVAVTVLRLEALIEASVMLDDVTVESSTFDLFMTEFCTVVLSTLEFCT